MDAAAAHIAARSGLTESEEEGDDDEVDVERRRLDLQAPLSLRPEEALRDGLLRESCDLASGALVRELGVGSVSSVFGRQR